MSKPVSVVTIAFPEGSVAREVAMIPDEAGVCWAVTSGWGPSNWSLKSCPGVPVKEIACTRLPRVTLSDVPILTCHG